jgi:hypothetical protein
MTQGKLLFEVLGEIYETCWAKSATKLFPVLDPDSRFLT